MGNFAATDATVAMYTQQGSSTIALPADASAGVAVHARLSALLAIPENMPQGQSPELRLLPGLYTEDNNVFIGGAGDADYPSTAR